MVLPPFIEGKTFQVRSVVTRLVVPLAAPQSFFRSNPMFLRGFFFLVLSVLRHAVQATILQSSGEEASFRLGTDSLVVILSLASDDD